MALKATVFRVQLNVADMDRHNYQDFSLTVARHPSETDERMMLRIVCFALHAHERLEFTRGISTDDEPDLWQKSLSGDIEQWIDLGQPDERRIRKACGRSQHVSVYCYGGHSAAIWFEKLAPALTRFENLHVVDVNSDQIRALAGFAARNMTLQVSIEDRQLNVSDDRQSVLVTPVPLYPDAGGAAYGRSMR